MALSCSSSSQFRFLPPKFINGRRPTAVNSSAAVVGRKERRSARKTRDEDLLPPRRIHIVDNLIQWWRWEIE
ncbi:hypothetical protein HPP92_025395 [Vanilla planifolia]|uniref:Uncharacterized protein n=1 Tax=Vanilla planifolia TaxID=51239 RepID=A0A835PIE2_VANPL|nr:hypothetical protein HPP92_025395 [Vanilla planifolia]